MKKDTSERVSSEPTGIANQSIRSCIVLQCWMLLLILHVLDDLEVTLIVLVK